MNKYKQKMEIIKILYEDSFLSIAKTPSLA